MKQYRLTLFLACLLGMLWAHGSMGSGAWGTLEIDVEGNGTTDPAIGTYTIMQQDLIDEAVEKTVLTADASDGWQFDSWRVQPASLVDDVRENPALLNIGEGYQYVTAVFIPIPGYEDDNDDGGGGGGGTGCFIGSCR